VGFGAVEKQLKRMNAGPKSEDQYSGVAGDKRVAHNPRGLSHITGGLVPCHRHAISRTKTNPFLWRDQQHD